MAGSLDEGKGNELFTDYLWECSFNVSCSELEWGHLKRLADGLAGKYQNEFTPDIARKFNEVLGAPIIRGRTVQWMKPDNSIMELKPDTFFGYDEEEKCFMIERECYLDFQVCYCRVTSRAGADGKVIKDENVGQRLGIDILAVNNDAPDRMHPVMANDLLSFRFRTCRFVPSCLVLSREVFESNRLTSDFCLLVSEDLKEDESKACLPLLPQKSGSVLGKKLPLHLLRDVPTMGDAALTQAQLMNLGTYLFDVNGDLQSYEAQTLDVVSLPIACATTKEPTLFASPTVLGKADAVRKAQHGIEPHDNDIHGVEPQDDVKLSLDLRFFGLNPIAALHTETPKVHTLSPLDSAVARHAISPQRKSNSSGPSNEDDQCDLWFECPLTGNTILREATTFLFFLKPDTPEGLEDLEKKFRQFLRHWAGEANIDLPDGLLETDSPTAHVATTAPSKPLPEKGVLPEEDSRDHHQEVNQASLEGEAKGGRVSGMEANKSAQRCWLTWTEVRKSMTDASYNSQMEIAGVVAANVVDLSLDPIGCRIVQSVLQIENGELKKQIAGALLHPSVNFMKILANRNGNYVIAAAIGQKMGNYFAPMFHDESVLEANAKDKYGSRVLLRLIQRYSEHPEELHTVPEIVKSLAKNAQQLMLNESGSIVVQNVAVHGSARDQKLVLAAVREQFLECANNKHACHCIDTAFKVAYNFSHLHKTRDPSEDLYEDLQALAREATRKDETGECPLEIIIKNGQNRKPSTGGRKRGAGLKTALVIYDHSPDEERKVMSKIFQNMDPQFEIKEKREIIDPFEAMKPGGRGEKDPAVGSHWEHERDVCDVVKKLQDIVGVKTPSDLMHEEPVGLEFNQPSNLSMYPQMSYAEGMPAYPMGYPAAAPGSWYSPPQYPMGYVNPMMQYGYPLPHMGGSQAPSGNWSAGFAEAPPAGRSWQKHRQKQGPASKGRVKS